MAKQMSVVASGLLLGLVSLMVGCPSVNDLSVTFDPADLTVPSGQVVSVFAVTEGGQSPFEYRWDWSGPEGTGFGAGAEFKVTPSPQFVGPVQYVIHVRVTDDCGHVAQADKLVTIGSPPPIVVEVNGDSHDGDNGDNHDDNHDGDQNSQCPEDFGCGSGKHCENGVCVDDPSPPVPDPTFTFRVEPQDGIDPEATVEGAKVTLVGDESGDVSLDLFWDVQNATRVDVFSEPFTSDWTGERGFHNETGGEPLTLNRNESLTWKLFMKATNSVGKSVTKSITITIAPCEPPPPTKPLPTVNVKVNGQDGPISLTAASNNLISVLVSWGSSDASSLTASWAWSGNKALSGTEVVVLIPGTNTLRLEATGPGGTVMDSATVIVSPH